MKNTTEYFRSVLSAQINNSVNIRGALSLEKYEVYSGKLNAQVVQQFFANVNKEQSEDDSKRKLHKTDVIIALKTIKTDILDSVQINTSVEEMTGILYLPATLSFDGTLRMQENKRLPWIPREYLFPMIEPQLSIGKADYYDDFLENTIDEKERIDSWQKFVEYAKKLYETVTGSSFYSQTVCTKGTDIELDGKIYITIDDSVNASFHIIALYSQIYENQPYVPLYKKLITNDFEETADLIPNSSFDMMAEHCGQMGGDFPLSTSQREAINHLNKIGSGEMLAVNGPPGTGKTTLLQSVVANMYVKRALCNESAPVIVATSTNNKAVTNIIDSFGEISNVGILNLECRWIKGVKSFAAYFPAKKKTAKMTYHCTSSKADGFAEEIDDEKNIEASKEFMMQQCIGYFNTTFNSVSQCRDLLHGELLNLDSQRKKCIKVFEKLCSALQGMTFNDKIKQLNDKKEEFSNQIEATLLKQKSIEDYVERCRVRMLEWRRKYQSIPLFIRLFSFFPWLRQRILTQLRAFKNPGETEFLSRDMKIEEIEDTYSQIIDESNKRINELNRIEQQQKLGQEAVDDEERKLLGIQFELHKSFEDLKIFNADIFSYKSKKDLAKIKKAYEECDVEKLNEYMDSTVRYVEFWLAVHYYECTWLLEKPLSENQRGKNIYGVLEKHYHRLAMVTPCMVMTFYRLPANFKAYLTNEKKTEYMYNFIDLLIVDEAGQVSPEIGAASFALAKRAIVVGDEKQIPPVWGVGHGLDISLAYSSGIIKEKKEFAKLQETGLNCSESSIMKLASNSCKYDKYGKGLFLSEHRRCYNEIIAYCNELVYKGHLEPLRGEGKKDKKNAIKQYLPQMGHMQIDANNSQKSGSSRINKTEAQQIVDWLTKNYQTICNAYYTADNNVTKASVLGIITPFKAQAKLIRSLLKKSAITDAIEVGTVHTFQGAERKVIILSTVYGAEDGCYFINRNKSLMNVAVSRAKDSFLVFGDHNCLVGGTNDAGAMLKRYTIQNVSKMLSI